MSRFHQCHFDIISDNFDGDGRETWSRSKIQKPCLIWEINSLEDRERIDEVSHDTVVSGIPLGNKMDSLIPFQKQGYIILETLYHLLREAYAK